jgi:hypothetical protein
MKAKLAFFWRTQCAPWLRRLALRMLRKLVDLADDRLHAAEVRFRDARVSVCVPVEPARIARAKKPTVSCPYPFPADELMRHRIRGRIPRDREQERTAPRRRRCTAAEFDLRFAR